jgi:hypothetical protein
MRGDRDLVNNLPFEELIRFRPINGPAGRLTDARLKRRIASPEPVMQLRSVFAPKRLY